MSTIDAGIDAKLLAPWPMDALRERLLEGDTLERLTGPKRTVGTHDVREIDLEAVTRQVMVETFGQHVIEDARRTIASTLGLANTPFPGSAMPDVVIRHGGKVHVLEVKSSRSDYNRFDNVVPSGVKQFLATIKDEGGSPWEVEQDLMRLLLYPTLSSNVGSCLFVMVDAYDRARGGRSWTAAFGSPYTFRNTVKTKFVQDRTVTLLRATTIEDLVTANASARLITCLVHPWQQ